jgi:uncharacterized protein (DUF427 family)
MARATWNGVVLAETSRPVLLGRQRVFPAGGCPGEYLARTRAWSVCPWKGLARYYTVRAGGQENKNAAWYYPHPSPLARRIRNHVAFWNEVQVDAREGAQAETGTGAAASPARGAAPDTGIVSRPEG